MRWDHLFDDLEAQLLQAARSDALAEVADLTRHERAQVGWFDRVAAGIGASIHCVTLAGQVEGRITDLGQDWLIVDEPGRGSAIVAAAAVVSIGGLPRTSDQAVTAARRFGLGVALRAISRDRGVVAVHDLAGGVWVGTIDFVGADHLEIAVHPADAVRRNVAVTAKRIVPWHGIAIVRRIP